MPFVSFFSFFVFLYNIYTMNLCILTTFFFKKVKLFSDVYIFFRQIAFFHLFFYDKNTQDVTIFSFFGTPLPAKKTRPSQRTGVPYI